MTAGSWSEDETARPASFGFSIRDGRPWCADDGILPRVSADRRAARLETRGARDRTRRDVRRALRRARTLDGDRELLVELQSTRTRIESSAKSTLCRFRLVSPQNPIHLRTAAVSEAAEGVLKCQKKCPPGRLLTIH